LRCDTEAWVWQMLPCVGKWRYIQVCPFGDCQIDFVLILTRLKLSHRPSVWIACFSSIAAWLI
jgi:hypothetical protein